MNRGSTIVTEGSLLRSTVSLDVVMLALNESFCLDKTK